MSRITFRIASLTVVAASVVGLASTAEARFGNMPNTHVTNTQPLFGNQVNKGMTGTNTHPLFGNQVNKGTVTNTHPLFGNQVR